MGNMAVSAEDVIKETEGMEAPDFLRYLIVDKFPGKTVVTTSLRARGMVTLSMVADIAPDTPVVFCHMKNMYPGSMEYKAEMIEKLGLKDVRSPVDDLDALPGDSFHCENLWGEDVNDGTRHYTTVPLNETLKPFDCWISVVCHNPYSYEPRPRVLQEGRLLRIHPLVGWQEEKVRSYLKERNLPFHPMAMNASYQRVDAEPPAARESYNY
jgi:phosphoadenosine phosphosulfate reductase